MSQTLEHVPRIDLQQDATLNAVVVVVRDPLTRQPSGFSCDVCEQFIPAGETVESRLLPCSRFCSAECRDEAELAAENARHI